MVKPLPKAFVDIDDPDHHLCSVGYMIHWMATRPFFHAETGVDLGGSDGARWGALMIFRVMATANEMLKRPDLYPGTEPLPSVQAITRYMSRCAMKLTEHIRQSFAKLHPECHLRFEQEQGGVEFRDADVSLYPEPIPALAVSLSSIRRSQPRSPLRTQQQKPQGKASSPTISVSAGVISRGRILKRSFAGPF
jgi:hypothetical protein